MAVFGYINYRLLIRQHVLGSHFYPKSLITRFMVIRFIPQLLSLLVFGISFSVFSVLLTRDLSLVKGMETAKEVNLQTNSAANENNDSNTALEYVALFGNPAPKIPYVETPVPVSNLALTLKGTFTHNDSSKAYALIENGGTTAAYRMSDEIAPGVQLLAIYSGKIIILRNGMHEHLIVNLLKGELPEQNAKHYPLVVESNMPDLPGQPVNTLQSKANNKSKEREEMSVSERLQALKERRAIAN